MRRIAYEFIAAILTFFGGLMVIARYGPHSAQKSVIYEWDFAKDGGAIGTLPMRMIGGDGNPPLGSLIDGKNVAVDVLTAVTSGGAGTLALQLEAAGDVQTAAAVSGAPWSTTGVKDPTLEAPLKVAVGNLPLNVVIAAFALTAGKIRVYVSYETLS